MYKIIYYCFYFLYSIQKNEYFDVQILIIDYFCRYENGSENLDFLSRAYMQTHTEPPFSYGSWIYNYLCNQCISPLMWVRISIKARCTKLCDEVCQWFATGRWFSPGPPVSSTNQTDRHHITAILLKVALNTIKQTNKQQANTRTHTHT